MNRKTWTCLMATTLCALLASCTEKTGSESGDGEKVIIESLYDWNEIATLSQKTLEKDFWREVEHGRYWIDNIHDDATFYHYWQTAHAMETIMDAYERTGDDFYKNRTKTILESIGWQTGGKYINNFYDDMAWMGIACLRAYDLFKDETYLNVAKILWEDVQGGWVEPDGGMLWNKNPEEAGTRNSCTHWTVACFGAKMYKQTKANDDLAFASKVYKWSYYNLYNKDLGATFSNPGNNIYMTYNQGVLIGSSLELYDITGRKIYLTTAQKCADFCIGNDKFAKEGIWRDEGASDGKNKNNGIFKGILAHYMKDFIASEYCTDNARKAYIQYLEQMGVTLYNAAKADFLFPGDWTRGAEDGERIYLGCELSGVILMECNAFFSKEYRSLMKYCKTISQE